MHRDIKLENILLHFPTVDLFKIDKSEKRDFLKKVDFTKIDFVVKLADLGLAKSYEY
jgi:serine/threonine protein kinase